MTGSCTCMNKTNTFGAYMENSFWHLYKLHSVQIQIRVCMNECMYEMAQISLQLFPPKHRSFPITSTTLQRSLHFLHPTVAQSYRTSVSTWSLLFGHSLLRGRHTYRNMLMTILLCHVCVIPYSSSFFSPNFILLMCK